MTRLIRVDTYSPSVVISRQDNKKVDDFEHKIIDIQQATQLPIYQKDGKIKFETDSEKILDMLKAYNIKYEVNNGQSDN